MKNLKFLRLPLLLILAACAKIGEAPVTVVAAGSAAQNIEAESALLREAGVSRKLVLSKGNNWATGISGFGVNSFSVLSGEYRLADRKGPDGDFSVRVTAAPLYFSGIWQSRPVTGNVLVYQCTGEVGFLAAVIMEDDYGTSWTAVFCFPFGLEEAGLSEDSFSQMLRAWTGRFLYFLSLSKSPSELSLPAVLDF